MKDARIMRIVRPSLALAALAAVLVMLGLAIVGPAHAATTSPTPQASVTAKAGATASATPAPSVVRRQNVVRFGDDILVPRNTQVPSAVAFGGDITVNGRVTESVVAFGGSVVVNGEVGKSVVAFGGDVRLGPQAVVGSDLSSSDSTLVILGGELTKAPGAQVTGRTETPKGIDWSGAGGWLTHALVHNSLLSFSFVGWVVQTVFFLVLALVAAALLPHQLRGVQQRLARRPWGSLGWGALAFFVGAPAILVVLVISIIGLLLVLPYGLFVLLACFFVTTAVAAFLAQKVLTGFGGRDNLMLAVVIGVVGTTVVSRIPAVGPVVLLVMTVMGVGAAVLGVAEWRRERSQLAAAQAAAAQGGVGFAPPPAPPQPSVITPIVATSPAMTAEAPPVAETAPVTSAEPGGTAASAPPAGAAAPAPPTAPPASAASADAVAPAPPAPPAAPAAPQNQAPPQTAWLVEGAPSEAAPAEAPPSEAEVPESRPEDSLSEDEPPRPHET